MSTRIPYPVRRMSRRDFLKMLSVGAGAAFITGCAPKALTEAPAATAEVPTAIPTEIPTEAPAGCAIDWNPTYPVFTKIDPTIEISVPFSASYDNLLEGDEILNNPMYNRIVEQVGIAYQIAWQADGSDYYTRLTNDLAAGTLPDAFRCKNSALASFIDTGAIADVTDIFEATASELTKQKKGSIDSYMWLDVVRDGRIFGIAYKEDGFGDDSLTYIRQDWLDQVGLPIPTTLEELTEVARAFKGEGLCEFPIGACVNLVTWQFGLDPVFGAFGIVPPSAAGTPGYWIKNDDNTLRYGGTDPAAKEALAILNTWFTEGLLNPDFINMDESGPNDAFIAGQVGIGFQPWWGGHANVFDLYATFPDAKVSVINNPKGPSGRSGRAGTNLRGGAILFPASVDPAKIEAVIKHMNWSIELHANWQKYQQYGEWFQATGFFRGYEWDLDENCNMILGKTPGSEWMFGRDLLGGFRGCTYPEYQADPFKDMAEWTKVDPSTLNMAQKFLLSDASMQRDIEYFNLAYNTRSEILVNAFKGRNTDAINNVLPDLLDFSNTAYLEFITGSRSLDTFDQFAQDWLDRGGQTYNDEVNRWAAENL